MRKTIFIFSILLLVVSCVEKIESEKLIGIWKMKDVIDQTGQNFSEEITFYKDSLVFEMFSNKKLTEKFSCQYKFDTVKNVLQYEYRKQKLNFKILKLTDSEMEVLHPTEEKPIRLIRVK